MGDVAPGDIRAVFHHRAPEGGHLPEVDSYRLAAPFGDPGPVPLEVPRYGSGRSCPSSSSRLTWPSPSSMRSSSRTSSGINAVTSARSSRRRPSGASSRRHKSSSSRCSGALAEEPLVALPAPLCGGGTGRAQVLRRIRNAGGCTKRQVLRQPLRSLLPRPAAPDSVDE